MEFAQARVNYGDNDTDDENTEHEAPSIDPKTSPEYCYILLRMSAGRNRKLKPEDIRVPSELAGDLTADDFVNMAVERARRLSTSRDLY